MNRASLVVEHGDGSVVTRCVAFSSATVTGEELLNLSGVAWSGQTFGGFGDAVCALDDEPVHYETCPGRDAYWAVFVSRGDGTWQLASVGISSLTLGEGDAEGFRYVPATGVPVAPIPAAGVCPAVATPAPGRSADAGASQRPAGAAASPAASAASAASPVAVADATARAPATSAGVADAAKAGASPPAGAPAPTPSGGADPGLLLAAGVGSGLAGLALLRLLVRRRAGP